MRSAIRLFLVLVTLVVILVAWITHQLTNPSIGILVGALVITTLVVHFILNILDHRDERRKRETRESKTRSAGSGESGRVKHAEGSFALKEKKSGLTWGGGNIKASEATRGTRRKFLGR
jgi:divalent metal cation (Fe/Co/Zn/Cd) transporter